MNKYLLLTALALGVMACNQEEPISQQEKDWITYVKFKDPNQKPDYQTAKNQWGYEWVHKANLFFKNQYIKRTVGIALGGCGQWKMVLIEAKTDSGDYTDKPALCRDCTVHENGTTTTYQECQ